MSLRLCTFSRTTVLPQLVLDSCPLGLKAGQKNECPCHKRVYNVPPGDLRLSSCTHPNDFRGRPVDPHKIPKPQVKRRIESDMTAATATPAPEKRMLFGARPDGTPQDIPIIGVCGGYGSGKTLLGETLCPEETIEIGIEDSSVTYSLPIKKKLSMYREVTAASGVLVPKPIDCWIWFMSILEKIASGAPEWQCRVLFIDPITDIQGGLVDWVRANAALFGKTQNQYDKASGLLWADVKAHAKLLLGRISRKVDCVIFTAHMGSVWSGGAPVQGKQKAKGLDTFKELASLYLHLNRDVDPKTGEQPAAPVACIAPPHGKCRLVHSHETSPGVFDMKPILPPRIQDFTWQKLRDYVKSPPNYAKLKKHELAQVETLGDDEKLLIANETARMELEAAQLREEQVQRAKEAQERNQAAALAGAPAAATFTRSSTPAQTQATQAQAQAQEAPKSTTPVTAPVTAPVVTPSQPDILIETITPWNRERCMAIVQSQIAELKLTPEAVAASAKKRGADSLPALNDTALEDFRKGLWTVLTKKAIEAERKTPIKKT